MHYGSSSATDWARGWAEIAEAAGVPGVNKWTVQRAAKRDGWPILYIGKEPVASVEDLQARIREVAKERAKPKPVDGVMAALSEMSA